MDPSPTRVAFRFLNHQKRPSASRVASRWHPFHEYVIQGDADPPAT
jgi:hypothetical protein